MLRILPGLQQLLVGAERLVVGTVSSGQCGGGGRDRGRSRRPADVSGRILHGLGDVGGGKVLLALPHIGADLGDDDDFVAVFRGSSSTCR